MTDDALPRRTVTIAALVGAFAASLAAPRARAQQAPLSRPDDMILGDPRAPISLIEYASVTCSACKAFHDNVMPDIKKRFIEPGRIKLVFREFLTPPAALAQASFLIARAAGPEKYFDAIDLLFHRQIALLSAAQVGRAGWELLNIAAAIGLDSAAYTAALDDAGAVAALQARLESAAAAGVQSTPTLFINTALLPVPAAGHSVASVTAALNSHL